jgi:hypothetical protein
MSNAPVHHLVGHEIDLFIALEIMGWKLNNFRASDSYGSFTNGRWWSNVEVIERYGDGRQLRIDFKPSSCINHAWEVVEHITTPGTGNRINQMPWATRFAHLFQSENMWAYNSKELSAAICKLSIKAAGLSLPNAEVHRAVPAPVQHLVGQSILTEGK